MKGKGRICKKMSVKKMKYKNLLAFQFIRFFFASSMEYDILHPIEYFIALLMF